MFGLEFTTRKWMLESSNRLQFTISAVTREIRAKTRLPDQGRSQRADCSRERRSTESQNNVKGCTWILTSLKLLLESVRDGRLSPEQAARDIRIQPFQEAGEFAKVDLHRRLRCGFPEVVFGQGKTAQQIEGILRTLVAHDQGGLVTRLDPQAALHLVNAVS